MGARSTSPRYDCAARRFASRRSRRRRSRVDLTDARLDGANLTNADLSHALHNRTDSPVPSSRGEIGRHELGSRMPSPCCLRISNTRCLGATRPIPNRSLTDVRAPYAPSVTTAAVAAPCLGSSGASPPHRRPRGREDAAAARFSTWRALRTMSCSIYCFDNLVVVRYEKIATPAPRRHRPRI